MINNEFLSKVKALINIESYADKVRLLEILSVCELHIHSSNTFTQRVWNQYWEYIELLVPIPLLEETNSHIIYLRKICNSAYIETEEYALHSIVLKPGSAKIPGELAAALQKVSFEQIQGQIIEQLESAQYLIWVAVAWLTDETLINILKRKSNEGVNVQVITINDEINAPHFSKYDKSFELIKANKRGYCDNIMHNKFCVIDLKTTLHGTYNWTNKARYNDETISVEISNPQLATQFADKFIELKVENH